MRKVRYILWGIIGVANAIGWACLGAIASMFFLNGAIEDFKSI